MEPNAAPAVAPEAALAALWPRFLKNRLDLKQARATVREHRALFKTSGAEIAAILIAQQSRLAPRQSMSGRAGGFDPWLREQGIPRSTAYDLIRRFNPDPQKTNPLKGPANTLPGLVLKGRVLTMHLSTRQAYIAREAFTNIEAKVPAFNAADELLGIVIWRLSSTLKHATLDLAYRCEDTRYSAPLPYAEQLDAMPTLKIPLGGPGYCYTQRCDPRPSDPNPRVLRS